ncbi:organic cation transporter-like protein isoform X2 [Eupeodes corollae]|uniref:organic cation transporter-like protein isoform X2 n=1 Tax=Eupeodes corollae TaxID=290404 RepID=UPI0024931DFB|nr:organic cation transporter-like protein isoform X2 [Eupeodes corollae]
MGKPRYQSTKIDNDDDEEDLESVALKFDKISYLIGDCGLWQSMWVIILSMFQLVCTFHIFSFVFQTMQKDFWCARPDEMSNMTVESWKNLTQPQGACSIIDFRSSNVIESNPYDYLQLTGTAANMTKCKTFEFSYEDYGLTIVEEYGLVCDRQNLLSVVEMCFLAGAAVGSVCSGWISDRFGRKHTLMGFALVQTMLGTLLAFSTSLAMFMTLRVIIGFASMTVAVVSFVLVVELVSGKWRTIIGILNILPVAISYILTSGIAYLTRDWRLMQLVISVPWIALLFIWYCVPESPRWLLARGRLDELVELIERAARMNGRTLPSNYRKSLEANLREATAPLSSSSSSSSSTPSTAILMMGGVKQSEADGCHSVNGTAGKTLPTMPTPVPVNVVPEISDISTKSPLVVVFNKDYWRTTVLTLIVWLTLIIIYFGLTLHLSNLGGNVYLNTAIAGLVESISICASIVVVLKLGIRKNLIAYMLISGLCCLAVNLVPGGNLYGVIGLAMIAKCVIGANNAIIPTFTAQQYPTVVRNFGLGMGNLAAGVALILVPYMWLLEHVSPLLPLTIMGVCGIVGAGALMMMKDVSTDAE